VLRFDSLMRFSHRFLTVCVGLIATGAAVRSAAAAQAFIIVDSQTGYILEEQEPRKKLQVGSLTKIATASVVLDWAERKSANLNEVITIPPEAFVGTLENNISFLLVPSSDETGAFHFESANVRFDNLFHSPWLNVKLGKFELDSFISEKRGLTLSGSGGGYQLFHFIPVNDGNTFGQVGDNQVGAEWMGHSFDDRTRLSAAVLSSTDGNPDVPYGRNSYTAFLAGSQAFSAGKLGVQRLGGYAMIGQAPTTFLTSGGVPVPGSGTGNKSFSRVGFEGLFYLGPHLDFQVFTQHGSDDAWFGACFGNIIDGPCTTNNDGTNTLPPGARNPTWNGAFVETHVVVNPQFTIFQRSEWIRMSQQALPDTPSNLGNIDNYVFGYRYNPFMNARDGFAFHNEYSWIRQRGTAPDNGDLSSNSIMIGFDFAF